MDRFLDHLSLRNMDQGSILKQSRVEGHEGMILITGMPGEVRLHPIRVLLQNFSKTFDPNGVG